MTARAAVGAPRALGIVVAFALCAACGSGASAPRAETSTVVDSAGIAIITSSQPLHAPGEDLRLSTEPTLTIGVVAGDDAYQLFRVSDAMRLDDGRIIVVNAGTRDVRIYAPDGTHIRTLGGPGEGPAEYGYPVAIRSAANGGFVVTDRMDFVRYDSAREFITRETFDRARFASLVKGLGPSEGGSALGDGVVLAPIYGSGFTTGQPQPGPSYRPEITVVRLDMNTAAVDTLAHVGGIRQQFVDVGSRVSPVVGPFASSGSWDSGRDGAIVIYDGELPQIERFETDGTHRIIRWSAPAEPVTSEEIEAWKETQRNASWAQDRLPELERGWAAIDMPTVKPFVTAAAPAHGGSTWVRTSYPADPNDDVEWRIFDADGTWLTSVNLPAAFRPTDIGADYVLGIHRDPELEVETIRMYAIAR